MAQSLTSTQRTHPIIKLMNDKRDRLTILDPNRSDNNISGGSHEIGLVFTTFSKAHDVLQRQLEAFLQRTDHSKPFSFLEELIGGNFSAYDKQRDALKMLHTGSNQYRGLLGFSSAQNFVSWFRYVYTNRYSSSCGPSSTATSFP